ncbi:hypothetical protein [Cohnella laeviribosi]|uniref:hypothetical protein n=1 Tax=Cohnella laeviribosi TaxID=380174 RepID=UPI00036284D6|nr:hypothetical protein [Cohnella laeviribosi]
MSYDHFKRKVQKAYPDAALSFSSNGAQHTAKVEGHLILYTNADSDAIYGMMNGVPIGRAIGIE